MRITDWTRRLTAPVERVLSSARAAVSALASRGAGTLSRLVGKDRGPDDSEELERRIGEAVRAVPTAVPEVVATLNAVARLAARSPRGPADGIASFTTLYRAITENVLRWLEEDRFEASAFLAVLDLEFAERYFQALRSYAFDRSSAPACWRVLFGNRTDPRLSRLHFAVAGVNAHINFDLALALVSTCVRLGVELGSEDQRRDYLAVNQIFAANTRQLRDEFEMRDDPVAVDQIQKLFDDFAIVASREVAWRDALRLWPHRHDPARMAQETWLLDQRAAVLGKGILAHPLLR